MSVEVSLNCTVSNVNGRVGEYVKSAVGAVFLTYTLFVIEPVVLSSSFTVRVTL